MLVFLAVSGRRGGWRKKGNLNGPLLFGVVLPCRAGKGEATMGFGDRDLHSEEDLGLIGKAKETR